MTATVPANEVQNDDYKDSVYKSLSKAAEATDGNARSKSFDEADQLLRKHNASAGDTKAISERLACEGKLGKLIIGEFGVGALGHDQTISKNQLQEKTTGEGATTPSKDLIASAVIEEFDQIDGTSGEKKDGLLTAIEIESWANYSGSRKFCASEAQTNPEAPVAGADETPTVFNEPSAPPESKAKPSVDPTTDPFANEFSTVPQAAKPRGFDARFKELRDPADPAPQNQITPPVDEKPQGFDARFKRLRDAGVPAPPNQVPPEAPIPPPLVGEKPEGFDARFKKLRESVDTTAPNQVPPETPIPPPRAGEKPEGFESKFRQFRQQDTEPEKASRGVSEEKWGTRTFDLQADGSARYEVKTGDTVWSIAADVAEKRLSRKPSNTEIVDLTKAISEASGLNKNGRNPDLIYADKDVLTIPPEKTEAPETGGIDKDQAVDAMRGLTIENLALMKKALEIQAQSDPKFEKTNLSLTALSALKTNHGELENKLSQTYPEALKNGFTAEQLSQFAEDPKNEINDQQRQSLKYITDNFSILSPEDQYLTDEDMQKFAAQALGLQRDALNKMVADEKNPLTVEERKTLSYFSSNFKTVSPDDDILTMPDLKAFVQKFELTKAAQAQIRASVKK